jgi:Xaa-Pro aminopeptidase
MTDVLIVGDTERSPELRHEIPIHIGDAFDPEKGFNHGLGHGVGLEVHDAPTLSKLGHELRAGDVITLEPGLYRHGFGGVRLEDLVVVTDDGCETITRSPYALDPAVTVGAAS